MSGRKVPSRRHFLVGASSLALAAPFVVSSEVRAQNRTLYVNTWGGSWEEADKLAYFQPFTQETGIQIRPVSPVSYAKLKAQVRAGSYDFDVTTAGRAETLMAEAEDLLDPIDWKIVQKEKLWADCAYGQGIGNVTLATPLVYRKDKFPNGGPKSWADFWDVKKFPGKRGMYKAATRTLGYALLADGVPMDKLLPMDFDRAFKKLSEIKPHINVWWEQGGQSEQIIRDNEVDMMAMWNARASALIADGVPIEIVWNGANLRSGNWVVPKGTPRREMAWQFVNYAAQAKNQAIFCRKMLYGPMNPNSFQHMSTAEAAEMPSSPQNRPLCWESDYPWEAKNLGPLTDRFSQWLAS